VRSNNHFSRTKFTIDGFGNEDFDKKRDKWFLQQSRIRKCRRV